MAEPQVKLASTPGNAAVQDYLDYLLQDASRHLIEAPVDPVSDEVAPVMSLSEPDAVRNADNGSNAESDNSADSDEKVVYSRPQWAEATIACLSFRVRGLPLAAPLIHLGGILCLEDRLKPLAAQADWFMGMLRWNERNIKVVDTERLLVPGEFAAPEEYGDRARGYDCVVVINDTDWGLAIDTDAESVSLAADDIRWRERRGNRPWMAGVATGSLCSILEIDAVTQLLDSKGEIGLEVANSVGECAEIPEPDADSNKK